MRAPKNRKKETEPPITCHCNTVDSQNSLADPQSRSFKRHSFTLFAEEKIELESCTFLAAS